NLRRAGECQVGLVHPAASIWGAMPPLQRDGADVLPFFIVKDLNKRLGEAGTDLGRGAAEVQQTVASIIEDGDGAPTLRLGLGVVEQDWTLHGLGVKRRKTGCRSWTGKSRASWPVCGLSDRRSDWPHINGFETRFGPWSCRKARSRPSHGHRG